MADNHKQLPMDIWPVIRSLQGWLRSIETLPTRQLPNLSAEANVGFDPWEQIHFGKDVLTWMQHMTGGLSVSPELTGSLYCTVSCHTWFIICCWAHFCAATVAVVSGKLSCMHVTQLSSMCIVLSYAEPGLPGFPAVMTALHAELWQSREDLQNYIQ